MEAPPVKGRNQFKWSFSNVVFPVMGVCAMFASRYDIAATCFAVAVWCKE